MADADAREGELLRIASVPSGHVYVRHLLPADGARTRVRLLSDPDPDDPRRPAGAKWWPPKMLEAEWVRAHAGEFDIFQIHFGFDARTPEQLRELVEALRAAGRPLVMTVHDLRNPHHEDRSLHDAQLGVLVPAAAVVVTLTPTAAREIERRWGRRAVVLPHPHVVDEATMRRVAAPGGRRRDDGRFVVGLHVKSLRANMAPLPVLETLIPAVLELPGGEVRVDGHRDLLEPGGARYDAELAGFLEREAEAGRIRLEVHDYFSDEDLWAYLSSLDASVLPYRFGTHSGWLEACADLGTRVIAPSCGAYADQGDVLSYGHEESRLDAESLRAAIRRAAELGPPPPVDVDARLAERERIAEEMAAVWARALEDAPTSCPPSAAPLAWDRARSGEREVRDPLEGVGSALCVSAHPDDEAIGAGRMLATAAARGARLGAVVLTEGEACAPHPSIDPAEMGRRRIDEWRRALAAFGVETLESSRHPDGQLAEAPAGDLAAELARAASRIRAEAIVAPWRRDPHPDHAAAGRAAARAAAALGIPCIEYPVWAMTWLRPDEMPVLGAELVAVATPPEADAARAAALAEYASQLEPLDPAWPPVVPERALRAHDRQRLALGDGTRP